MQLTWLGHSCVLLAGSRRVLIDPFIEGGSVLGTNPDLVAVTHGHDDHLGEAVALGKKTVATTEIARYLKSRGVPAEGMNIGGTMEVDGVSFTMTPAMHSGGIEEGGVFIGGSAAAGFVVEMDGVKVYHAGDTGLFSDMKLIGELYRPDVALLPIGGRYTMGTAEADDGGKLCRGKDRYPYPLQYLGKDCGRSRSFKKAIELTTDLNVKILKPGESITVQPE